MPYELTTQEVADLLDISTAAVRQLRLRGRLVARRRVGQVWLYRLGDVEAYQQEQAHRRRPGPPRSTPPA